MNLPALLLATCAAPQGSSQPGLLLVMIDDVGSEYLDWTDEGQEAVDPAKTPVMSSLAAEGIVYEGFWSGPACSITRGAVLTGRYGHRTGVSANINPTFSMSLSEVTIADRLLARGYETALFGKWHLGNSESQVCDMGFELWDGTMDNLKPGNYVWWNRTKDTSTGGSTTFLEHDYATRVVTNAAIDWIEAQTSPWFAAVQYHAAHEPLHTPPGMWPVSTKEEKYRAMIEYLDGDIGRLLNAIDLHQVTVWIISDNGVGDLLAMAPNQAGKSKYTSHRGGVETGCLVAGASVRDAISKNLNVPGQRMTGHVHAVDFYRTALMLMPGPDSDGWPAVDSQRLYVPGAGWLNGSREWNFTEIAEPVGVPAGGPYTGLHRAVEEGPHKAIWTLAGPQLYDVAADPWETSDLLLDGTSAREQNILDSLSQHLTDLGL